MAEVQKIGTSTYKKYFVFCIYLKLSPPFLLSILSSKWPFIFQKHFDWKASQVHIDLFRYEYHPTSSSPHLAIRHFDLRSPLIESIKDN